MAFLLSFRIAGIDRRPATFACPDGIEVAGRREHRDRSGCQRRDASPAWASAVLSTRIWSSLRALAHNLGGT
jgi:hypothetical protein